MSLETRDTCAQSLVTPTKPGDVFSTAVLSNGNPYGVAEGLVYSFPCRSKVLPHSASDRTLSVLQQVCPCGWSAASTVSQSR